MESGFQTENEPSAFAHQIAAPLSFSSHETEAEAEAARIVTERLNAITTGVNRAKRRFTVGLSAASFCVLLGLLAVRNLVYFPSPLYRLLGNTLFGVEGIALLLLVWRWGKETPKFDAVEIARLGGIRAIPPFCMALHPSIPGKQIRATQDALILLLPQLKASDAYLLTPTIHRIIATWLNNTADDRLLHRCPADLCIAALKALEQVGDSRDIPAVKRWRKIKPQTPGQAKIKQAAIECLPLLMANCSGVEANWTLLRASHAEDARPDTLLRPASGAGNTDAAELLRGTDGR